VSAIGALNATNPVVTDSATTSQSMTADDFIKIMITELTNQDPFEPIKNQDLLAQMAGIQQIQSAQTVTKSFGGIAERFDGFLGRLDEYLLREQLNTAAKSIGQVVSGTTTGGRPAVGKVLAVNVENGQVYLEIDTGERIPFSALSRLGGANGRDLLGAFVAGQDADGQSVAGIVQSLETDGSQITLQLADGARVPLASATVITPDTAYLLIGKFVEGGGDRQGIITGYRLTGAGTEGITLLLDTGQELTLRDVTKVHLTEA